MFSCLWASFGFLQVQHAALRKHEIKEAAGICFFEKTAAYHVSSEQMSSLPREYQNVKNTHMKFKAAQHIIVLKFGAA